MRLTDACDYAVAILTAWGKRVIGRMAMLREQAAILRSLAATVEIPTICDELLNLAVRCDELAKVLEDNPPVKTETP